MNKKGMIGSGVMVVCLVAALFVGWQWSFAENNQGGGSVPSLISYQGFLADSNDDPLADGDYMMDFALYDAQSSGSLIWEETHSAVTVSGGYFAVMLGSGTCTAGCPLGPEDFSEPTRYLETSVDIDGGPVDFPRQQLGSVPYAMQAPMEDTGGGGPAYENVITVALSGGDYTSVADAVSSISDAGPSNRYLVRVMPGIYTETDLVQVQDYVHLQGAGPNVTVVTSSRTNSTQNSDAATVQLDNNGRISDLTVENTGTGNYGIAIISLDVSEDSDRDGEIDNVVATVSGSGGVGHFAVFAVDAEPVIRNSTLFASGAVGFGTAVNAAFASINGSGGFPQALIENSKLIGGANNYSENCNDPTGTGYGLALTESSPLVRDSYVCGGHRAVVVALNGHAQFQGSSVKVSSTSSAYLLDITASGSIKFANSGLSYVGNKSEFPESGLSCVHAYNLGTYAALTDAVNSSTACD